jgi:NAD(P)-dependent dehydrogenase (short-subunit alcohol dehydrogenase family)
MKVFPQTALVTGGASGIGAATVRLLEEDGAEVQVLDLSTGFDVSDPEAWESVEAVEFAYLNAGVTTGEAQIAEVTDGQYRRIMGANVDGVVLGVRRLSRVMERGSAITATASLAGLVPTPNDPLYALTKHAVVGFVRSIAPQLEERGIRINAVCPGIVDTPLIGEGTRERFEEVNFPLLQPEEVAAAALMAARSSLTGQAWAIQPGREPVQFRFPNVPGPRMPGSEGRLPPGYESRGES